MSWKGLFFGLNKKIDLGLNNIKNNIHNYCIRKMIIPIKCFTCGTVMADKYVYYCEEVRRIKRSKGLDVDKVLYLTKEFSEKTAEGEVLDEIGLKKMCCRRHMLTHVDIE
jgi:DNA-directed RNA polymerase I, II, and III subunit RPABC5